MVIGKAIYEVVKAVARADYKVLRFAGWKPAAAGGISSGIGAGTFITQWQSSGDELDTVQTLPSKSSSGIQYKARYRLKCNPGRRYPVGHPCYGRSPNSRSNYSSANSNRR